MARTEEDVRREAVRRRLAGESPEQIGRSLGRSRQWVARWVARYDPADPAWAASRSRAPKRVANRTAPSLERQVLAVRDRLASDPWAQIGAHPVAWELQKLGVDAPATRTIEAILKRNGRVHRPKGQRRRSSGIVYPAPIATVSGDVHQVDLVGPRHIDGGRRFFALNAVDVATRNVGVQIIEDRSDEQVQAGLLEIWSRLGVPKVCQMDNGGPFAAPRGLTRLSRTCVLQGAMPLFIPAGEPWRNGIVEQFNSTFDRRFFRTERFSSLAMLAGRASEFEAFHNQTYRYRVLDRRTPSESAQGTCVQRPIPLEALPGAWPTTGSVAFVRFVRSDRKLRLPGRTAVMPPEVAYEYLTATIDLGIPGGHENVAVRRHDHKLVACTTFALPRR